MKEVSDFKIKMPNNYYKIYFNLFHLFWYAVCRHTDSGDLLNSLTEQIKIVSINKTMDRHTKY